MLAHGASLVRLHYRGAPLAPRVVGIFNEFIVLH